MLCYSYFGDPEYHNDITGDTGKQRSTIIKPLNSKGNDMKIEKAIGTWMNIFYGI